MQLAKVIGQVVSTIKEPGLDSFKILLVEEIDPAAPEMSRDSNSYLAVDLVGAGEGEVVVVTEGGAARVHEATAHTATDSAVIAIVDSVTVGGRSTFRK
jgi:ethanolamine utilization protein EutN